jgi:hypothetical protein
MLFCIGISEQERFLDAIGFMISAITERCYDKELMARLMAQLMKEKE